MEIKNARIELAKDEKWDTYFEQIFYRPFDVRYIYYTQDMVDWPRPGVMPNMFQDNLGIIVPKRVESKIPWQHAFISNKMVEHVAVSLKTTDYLFPLFIYPNKGKEDLFSQQKKPSERESNINPIIFENTIEAFKKEQYPEEIFYYIYAVLYSDIYRRKYAEFLKIDFPRIPFTNNFKLFSKMAEHGRDLVELHLLKSKKLENPMARFQGKGDNKVEKVRYEKDGVYINNDQYFDDIKPEVWEYQIGGYQVCEKWLKDRKGRKLSLEDIKHYCKDVTALEKTIAIQKEIDKLYPKVEENLINFSHH